MSSVAHKLRIRLARGLPRPVAVITAELAGVGSIPTGNGGNQDKVLTRLSILLDRDGAIPGCPLFDRNYYIKNSPDLRESRWPALLHFLVRGGFEGRKPHPLFDPEWYMAQHVDVASCGLNPLQHYMQFGWREERSPHPLFDASWYLYTYPDVKAAGCEPLKHYLEWGAGEGRQPHPLFDTRWYVRRYAEVADSGLNPLTHYLTHGGTRLLNPNRSFNARYYAEQYPDSIKTGTTPLEHYVLGNERSGYNPHPGYPRPLAGRARPRGPVEGALKLIPARAGKPDKWSNSFTGETLPVFVVYGSSNVRFIEAELIPALAAQSCRTKLHVHAVNYRHPQSLFSAETLAFARGAVEGVTDWSEGRGPRHMGFGEGVNFLFEHAAPGSCFLLVNPDSMPMPGCIERLLETFYEGNAALVEARQWPSEHPKEYEAGTGWTPWASGAFVLIAAEAFRRLEGFDPLYFLYNEDVDLSWRAWLQDMPVVHEPRAMCAHFTGLLSYRPTRFYYEHFFSVRNFLLIAYKFFGDPGEAAAWRWIEEARLPTAFRAKVEESYLELRGQIRRVQAPDAFHADKIKILGLNLYHQLRRV